MQVGLRNFDVKAEHLVIADLQRADSRALALAFFHGRDNLPATSGDIAQFVKFRVETASNDAWVRCHSWRIVGDATRDFSAHVGKLVQLLAKPGQAGAGDARLLPAARFRPIRQIEQRSEHWKFIERLSKSQQVARSRDPKRDSAGEPLEVENPFELLVQLLPHDRLRL